MSRKAVRGTSTPSPEGHSSGGSSSSGGTLRQPTAMGLLPSGKMKPKRSSFPCVACGKTFPTQQAMAGHSSTHSRARLNGDPLAGGHSGWPGPGGAHVPAAAVVPRPSYLPFVHHSMSNQQLPRAPPCVQLLGPNMAPPQMADVTMMHAATAHHVQATQVGWGPLFPYYTLLPPPPVPSVPVRRDASSTSQQRVDLTLQLGSGGRNGAQGSRRLLPVAADGGGGETAAMLDGGDAGRGQVREDDLGCVDLELRLCR